MTQPQQNRFIRVMIIIKEIQINERQRCAKLWAMTCGLGRCVGAGCSLLWCFNRCNPSLLPPLSKPVSGLLHNPHYIMVLTLIERQMSLFGLNPSLWHRAWGVEERGAVGRVGVFDLCLCTTPSLLRQLDRKYLLQWIYSKTHTGLHSYTHSLIATYSVLRL